MKARIPFRTAIQGDHLRPAQRGAARAARIASFRVACAGLRFIHVASS
jgi:hypothetical protein